MVTQGSRPQRHQIGGECIASGKDAMLGVDVNGCVTTLASRCRIAMNPTGRVLPASTRATLPLLPFATLPRTGAGCCRPASSRRG